MIAKFLLSYSLIFFCAANVMAEYKAISNVHSQKNIVLNNLDFKTVMMAFYQKDIQYRKIEQLDSDKVQYVGIKEALNTRIHDDDAAVIIFSPAQVYKNAQNELRYLLTTTEVAIDKEGRDLKFCGVCATYTQVYIFKKNSAEKFEIISQSDGTEGWVNDEFTYLPYPTETIIKNIKKVGPDLKGYVEEQVYSRQGYSKTKLFIMPLNDNPKLVKFEVAEIGNDNEVTGNENTYNTQGDYKFLNAEHDGLYDIEIRYSGTKEIYKNDVAKIIPVKETHVYRYNAKQQKYLRVK